MNFQGDIRFHRFHRFHRFDEIPETAVLLDTCHQNARFHRSQKSSISSVDEFWWAWFLAGFGFIYLTQNCLDSVSDLKICTIFESKLIPTSCDANTKHLIGTCSLPVRKAPWKIIAARVNHFQKPNDDTTRCMLHSIPTRPS